MSVFQQTETETSKKMRERALLTAAYLRGRRLKRRTKSESARKLVEFLDKEIHVKNIDIPMLDDRVMRACRAYAEEAGVRGSASWSVCVAELREAVSGRFDPSKSRPLEAFCSALSKRA